MKKLIFLAAAAVIFALPGAAEAKLDIFSGSAGVLMTVGGDLWTKPDSSYNLEAIPFGDTAGGYGVGGGVFFEARFIKFIGLELDLLFEYNSQWYDLEITTPAGHTGNLKHYLNYLNIRLPILLKAVIPAGIVRVSIGLGPEFVFSRSHGTRIDATAGFVPGYQFLSEAQNDVYLSVALGFAFKIWKFSIPLNIRYAYNCTQPKSYAERLKPSPSEAAPTSMTLTASETMDLRLMIGLAYDF